MIYDNQKACGTEIFKTMFGSEESATVNPVVLLLAQMQMGKSGTYWHVIFEALRNRKVDQVFIISGNREKTLRKQVKMDVNTYTDQYGKKYKKKITVLWGADLYSAGNPIEDVPENTLIVWDEAHYAQSKSNGPYKFFEHNGLEGILNGTMELQDIIDRKIYLLNVSATPFSELYSNFIQPCDYHKVVRLLPDKSYFGVDYYIKENRLCQSFVVDQDRMDDLEALFTRYNTKENPRYMLVRVCNTKDATRLVESVCEKLDIVCHQMNSKISTISIDDLEEKPSKPTVVVLSGMLRMGKVVPKDHIAMVFEAKPAKSNRHTDTGLQGLLGRVCGHTQNPSGFDIDVYIEPNLCNYVVQYAQLYHYDEGPLINPAMNLKASVNSRSHMETNVQCMELLNPTEPTKKALMKMIAKQYNTLNNYNFVMKNLLTQSNKTFLSQIEKAKYTSYIEPNTCYVCKLFTKEEQKVWLLIGDGVEREPVPEPMDMDIIRDSCVFKPTSSPFYISNP